MNQRLKISLIGFAALVVPAVIILVVVNQSPSLSNSVLRLANQSDASNTNLTVTPVNTNAVAPDPDALEVEYIARNFSETYASSSNQNDFAHVERAKQWGTENFNAYLDRVVAQERQTLDQSVFTSTVSQALVISITNRTATAAAAVVSLQREETIDQSSRTYTQDMLLNLVKQGDDWFVNAVSWGPENAS